MNLQYQVSEGRKLRMWRAILISLFTLACGMKMSIAKGLNNAPPKVISASVPFYPVAARIAHIQGVVRLRITTNGKTVSAISVQVGHPALASAAEENVRGWQFSEHSPTTFEATFRYKMLTKADCEMDNGTVLLRLPTEVEVSAKPVQTCDPSIESKSTGK